MEPQAEKAEEELLTTENPLAKLVHQLESLTTSSSAPSRKPSLTSVGSIFQDCESYMNWICCEKNPDYYKYIQTAESHFSVYTIEAFVTGATIPAQCHSGQEWEFDENKRYNMFEHLTNLGALAFFYTQLEDYEHARHYIDRAFECIEQIARERLIPVEYLDSFRYVIGFAVLYADLYAAETENSKGKDGDLSLFKTLQWFYYKIPTFQCLSVKAQAGVLGMKQYFWKMIKHDVTEAVKLAREIVTMDPEFYEWHYVLQACLRSQRRKHSYHHYQLNPLPSEEEKDAVIKANALYPYHPRYMLSEILLLAEYIKASYSRSIKQSQRNPRSPSEKQEPIFYQKLDFERLETVVAYIKDRANEILKRSPKSVHINTTLSEIFTVLLPHRYRDFNFGRSCLERCLVTHPWSSKANHRMGTFFLNAKAPAEDMALAEEHFRIAVTADPRNFPSLCALIQVMMRNVQTDSEQILQLLKEKMGLDYWDEVQRGNLHYLKGLVLFAVNRRDAGISAFMKATKLHPGSLTFEDLPYQHKRYAWPVDSHLELRRLFETLSGHRRHAKRWQHNFIDQAVLPKLGYAIRKERNFTGSGKPGTSTLGRRCLPPRLCLPIKNS